jgi:transcriptional regulator
MAADRAKLLQGTLDLLILKTLALGELHGWGISRRIRQLSDEVLAVNQGSLYPALYRLEDQDLIAAKPGRSSTGRPIKLYSITTRGRAALGDEARGWRLFSDAVDQILGAEVEA